MTTQPPPNRLLVHVDTLDKDKVQQFEEARVRFVTVLRTRHKSDRRGLYLKVGTNTYWSVTSFARWRELEQIGDERAKVTRALAAESKEYDRLCDETLVFPHASEVWPSKSSSAHSVRGPRSNSIAAAFTAASNRPKCDTASATSA